MRAPSAVSGTASPTGGMSRVISTGRPSCVISLTGATTAPKPCVNRAPQVQLARCEHHLPLLAVDRVAIDIHVLERVERADRLDLGKRVACWACVEEADVGERRLIGGDLLLGHGRFSGERRDLDLVEAPRQPRHVDVAVDEELFLLDLVGVDLEGLDERGIDESADDAGDDPEADGEGGDAPAPTQHGVGDGRQAGERAEQDHGVARRQARVDVGIRRAGDDAEPRCREVEGGEVRPDGDHQQDEPDEHRDVDAHAARDLQLEALQRVRQCVHGARAQRGDHEQREHPALEEVERGQVEHVERHVAVERRVFHAEVDGVPPRQHRLPRPGGDRAEDDREEQRHREHDDGDDAPDGVGVDVLDERLLEALRGEPAGEPDVEAEHDECDQRADHEEHGPGGQDALEVPRELDGVKPEVVDVDRLGDVRRHEQQHDGREQADPFQRDG